MPHKKAVSLQDVCTDTFTLSYKFYHPVSYAISFGLVKNPKRLFLHLLIIINAEEFIFQDKGVT